MTVRGALYEWSGQLRGTGRRTLRAAARARDSWSVDELLKFQARALQKRIQHALERWPAYAKAVGWTGGATPPIEELPIWSRKDQQDFFANHVGEIPAGAFVHATGGSSGHPVA